MVSIAQIASSAVDHVDDFLKIYRNRPLSENEGGMGVNHAFCFFVVLRELKPSVVIESGVWRGQGTWLIRQAVPNSQIVCIDPRLDLVEHVDPQAEYRKDDFSQIDWSGYDIEHSLCIFDDHQNVMARLKEMKWWGFRLALFDDNYPPGHGDCYSLRKVFSGSGHPHRNLEPARSLRGLIRHSMRFVEEGILNRHGSAQTVTVRPNQSDLSSLEINRIAIQELPPLVLNQTSGWGTAWSGKYQTSISPIFQEVSGHQLLEELVSTFPKGQRFGELNYNYPAVVQLGNLS